LEEQYISSKIAGSITI